MLPDVLGTALLRSLEAMLYTCSTEANEHNLPSIFSSYFFLLFLVRDVFASSESITLRLGAQHSDGEAQWVAKCCGLLLIFARHDPQTVFIIVMTFILGGQVSCWVGRDSRYCIYKVVRDEQEESNGLRALHILETTSERVNNRISERLARG